MARVESVSLCTEMPESLNNSLALKQILVWMCGNVLICNMKNLFHRLTWNISCESFSQSVILVVKNNTSD